MLAHFTESRAVHYISLICTEEEIMLVALDFDIGIIETKDQPYVYVDGVCRSNIVSDICRKDLFEMSVNIVNISLQRPLCLYYHPKIIAAAVLQMAMIIREINGFQPGVLYKSLFQGHPWYKLIDSEINIEDMQAIIDTLWPLATRESYNRPIPVPQVRQKLPEPQIPPVVLSEPVNNLEVEAQATVPVKVPEEAKDDASGLPNGH